MLDYIDRLYCIILPSNVSYTCRIVKQNSVLRAIGPAREPVNQNHVHPKCSVQQRAEGALCVFWHYLRIQFNG